MAAPGTTPPPEPLAPDQVRLVLVTAPPDRAHELARLLVEQEVAACVNVVPGLRSIYRWKGAVQDDPESLLVIKTRLEAVDLLAEVVQGEHPYDVPEFLVFTPSDGSEDWLSWLAGVVPVPNGDTASEDPAEA